MSRVLMMFLAAALLFDFQALAKDTKRGTLRDRDAAASGTNEAEGEALGRASELLLPPYQLNALTKDLPASDLRFTDERTLTVLGKAALWQWQINAKALQRLTLWRDQKDISQTPLRYLGGDGVNLFAAADTTLFQIRWQQNQVFLYPLASGTKVRGFAGHDDDFWLLHSTGLMQFDRYGKTLIPQTKLPYFTDAAWLAFDPAQRLLWAIRGSALLLTDLKQKKPQTHVVFTAQHPLRGLALLEDAGGDIMTHTDHAVLRFDPTGSLRQSFPVEGTRRLLAMAFNASSHAYLFSDQLLEVFDVQRRRGRRYRLPFADGEEITAMQLSHQHIAFLEGGRPRLFRLDTDERKR